MDAHEASKAFAVFAEGLGKLCDKLYSATQSVPDASGLQSLIEQAHQRQRAYQELDDALTGGMKASLHSSYSSEMDEIAEYLSMLEPTEEDL